ncbi:MAG: nucleoside-diphosphate kinase [Micropruina sp.]|nr:MAG: nucleoside-diphosphate kinase [Micropruina sp.]
MSEVQRTFVLIKPDAVRRGLVGAILARYENKGLAIEALQLRTIDGEFADRHYAEHVDASWYPPLRGYITSGPLVALVLSGPGAVEAVRTMHGATDGITAAPGSVRGDYALSNRENAVHASDSVASAEREIGLWFDAS